MIKNWQASQSGEEKVKSSEKRMIAILVAIAVVALS